MKALILNSGMGSRMGEMTKKLPKCMVNLYESETILSRQLKILHKFGIDEIIMTTGYFDLTQKNYIESLNIPLKYIFINNPQYDSTNYIYSIYLANKYLNDEIILLHGDLVFEEKVLDLLLSMGKTSVIVSSTKELPQKDFKARISKNGVLEIGVECFENSLACQPLYFLEKKDLLIWKNKIREYCLENKNTCYAEVALNELLEKEEIKLAYCDVKDLLCSEIDSLEDLKNIKEILQGEIDNEKEGFS